MIEFTDDELIDYVQGVISDRTRLIEEREQKDKELAALIRIMCAMTGRTVPAGRSRNLFSGALNWKPWQVRSAVAAVVILLGIGVIWATRKAADRPLLEAHFTDDRLDETLWTGIRGGVRPEAAYVRLFNRGYLVTLQEFEGPIDLRFRWRWVDLTQSGIYSEVLTVALRTSGQPLPNKPFEVRDGIRIILQTAGNGRINVSVAPTGNPIAETNRGAVSLPPEAWHDIRITDNEEEIAVYISSPGSPGTLSAAPILRAPVTPRPGLRHIAFYNREVVADFPHESQLTDIIVRRLK